jgi:hypothetical protein
VVSVVNVSTISAVNASTTRQVTIRIQAVTTVAHTVFVNGNGVSECGQMCRR